MPNWCRGTLKVRGTKEDLTRFIFEGLQPTRKTVKLLADEYGYIESGDTYWIENTYRGFVDGVRVVLSEYEDDAAVIALFDARFAWGIDAEDLLKTCKKYHVDMKIKGYEKGMQFNQDIEIVDGEILKDEEIKFDNYKWDCDCPTVGG